MQILLVGNKGVCAAGLGRELGELGLDWHVEDVADGDAAFAGMEAHAAGVVACSARMANGEDGVAWMARLRQRWPDTVRILVAAEGEDDAAMHALESCHRVLPAPLAALPLAEAAEGVMELRALLDDPALKAAIDRVGSLPAAPQSYMALTRLLRDPTCNTARIAAVVSQDPTIAARVLRLSNSAFYSGGREISDLRTAVTRVGQAALRQLVLASEVFAAGAEADAMRDRALRISQLAGQVLPGSSAELAITAGLLAEVGMLLPRFEGSGGQPAYAVAGAYLLGLWGLPGPIVEAVAFHREPARLRGSFWVAGAVHVAAAIVNEREVDEAYLRSVGMLDRLPRWRAAAQALAEAA